MDKPTKNETARKIGVARSDSPAYGALALRVFGQLSLQVLSKSRLGLTGRLAIGGRTCTVHPYIDNASTYMLNSPLFPYMATTAHFTQGNKIQFYNTFLTLLLKAPALLCSGFDPTNCEYLSESYIPRT